MIVSFKEERENAHTHKMLNLRLSLLCFSLGFFLHEKKTIIIISMEERQEIQVKPLPWMSEDDTKHTSKARKNPMLIGDDFHRMHAKGTCLYLDVSYLAVFKLSIWVNSRSPVSILSF